MKFKKTLTAIAIAATLTGCTMTQNQRTGVGAGIGAVFGGVLGHQINHKHGRFVGAILGALAGGAIGHYMDNQQRDLENSLASSGISVTRIDEATIKLHLPSSITFATNSTHLSQNVYGPLSSIASIVNRYEKTAVHVLGFTDSVGKAQYNVNLSQRRAQSVANYMANRSVVQGRLVPRGYGELYPIASNSTATGKAQNRRAEIYIRAIRQGSEQMAYDPIY